MNRTAADRHIRAQGLTVVKPQRSRPARLLGLLIRLRADAHVSLDNQRAALARLDEHLTDGAG